ncbi:MAG: glycosyltransferase family 39 protein [bacterium]
MRTLFKNKLLIILVLAIFLRLFLLSRVPPSLNWDEVSMGYTAYSVAETARDEWGDLMPIFFRSYGEWKSAVYIYLLVPFVKIFGLNAWVVRFPSALAGIISVYLVYLLGRKLYSERIGLWSALFMAITPWSFVLSRPAFEANVSLTLMLAGIYLFIRSLQSNNYFLIAGSAIALGLAPHTYNSAKVIIPFLVLYLVWVTKFYKNLKKTFVLFGILFIFALPILTNFISGKSQFRYTQVGITTDLEALDTFVSSRVSVPGPTLIGKLIFNKYSYTLYGSINNWFAYLDPSFLIINGGEHNQHHVPYHGVLYLSEFILILVGISSLIKRRSTKHSPLYLPLIIIAVGIIPAALTRGNGHVLRTILTIPGWAILAGLGMDYLQQTKTSFRNYVSWLLIIETTLFIFAYFIWYPKAYSRDWQYGYKEMVQYVSEHESEYDHIVITKWYGEPQLFFAYYNKWDPVWFQQENKQNLRYESEGRPWLDQLPEYGIGKYTFKYINWQEDQNLTNTLVVGKPDDFYSDTKVLKQVNLLDGSPAFLIVAR